MTDLHAYESQIWNYYHIGSQQATYTEGGIERFQYLDAYIETPEDGDENVPVRFRGEFVTEVPKTMITAGAVFYNYITWMNSNQEEIAVACIGTVNDDLTKGTSKVFNYKGTAPMMPPSDVTTAWNVTLENFLSGQRRAAREKVVDTTGGFEEFADKFTVTRDPNTGEEITTFTAPDGASIEERLNPDTGDKTTTMTKTETIEGADVEFVQVVKEDKAADTVTFTNSIDGKVMQELVTSLSDKDEMISMWVIETNPDGTSQKVDTNYRSGMMIVTHYDADGKVTKTQEMSMGGRRLNADDFDWEQGWTYQPEEPILDYGVPFFQASQDRPFNFFDVSDVTTLTFCSFELTERAATVEKVVRDLNGANRQVWDGVDTTKPRMIYPGGNYTQPIQLGARYWATADATSSTQLQYINSPVTADISLPSLNQYNDGDVNNATETQYKNMFDTATSQDPPEGTQEITTMWNYGMFTANADGALSEFEFDASFNYAKLDPNAPEFSLGIVFTTALQPVDGVEFVDIYQYALMEQIDENGELSNRTMAVSCKVNVATQTATVTGINGTAAGEANVTEFSPSLETDYAVDPSRTRWSSVKDMLPHYYESGQYDWNGYNYQMCAAMRALSSVERLDGMWMITTGTYITTADTNVVMNSEVSEFVEIRAPRTERVQVDYQFQGSVEGSSQGEITYTKADNSQKVWQMLHVGMDLLYKVPNDTESDNTMILSMKATVVNSDLSDVDAPRFDFLVMYRKVGQFGPSRIATCTTGFDKADLTQPPQVWINNFRTSKTDMIMSTTTSEIDELDLIGASVTTQTDAVKDWWTLSIQTNYTQDAVIFQRNEKDAFYTPSIDATGSGMAVVPCFAELDFSKFDDGSSVVDKDFFGDYEVTLGLKVRDANAGRVDLKWAADPQILSVKSPRYDDSISSVVEALTESQRIEFMAPEVVDGDTSVAFGQAQNAYQPSEFTFNAFGLSVKDNSTAPLIRLEFKSKIDKTAVAAGDVQVMYLRATNEDIFTDDLVLQCITTVGGKSKIGEYVTDFDPTATTNRLGAAMDEKQVKPVDMITSRATNEALYFGVEKAGFWESNCVIDIELNDKTEYRLSDILDWYHSMSFGAMYFQKGDGSVAMDKIAPFSLLSKDFFAYVPSPVYQEELDIEEDVGFFHYGSEMTQAVTQELNTYTATAFKTVDMSWVTAPEIGEPDLLKISFSAEIPNSWLGNTADEVAFFLKYRPEWERTENKWNTVVCIVNGGNEGALLNYEGVFDYPTYIVGEATRLIPGVQPSELVTNFLLNSTSLDSSMFDMQNTVVNCTAVRKFDKKATGSNLDMNYVAQFGMLRLQSGGSVTLIGQEDSGIKFYLTSPQYDFGQVDQSDFIIQPAQHMFNEFKASDYDPNQRGYGSLQVAADYYMTPFFGIDDKLVVSFTLDMPIEMLPKGAWVFQYMQIFDENKINTDEEGMITLGCTTQVGGEVHKVTEYQGLTRMDNVTMAGTTVKNQNEGEIYPDSGLRPTGNISDYATQESWVEGNRLQPCVIELPIDKENPDTSIYTDWRGWYGARIYKNLDDVTPLQIKEQKTSFYLEQPNYDEPIPSKEDLAFFEELAKYFEDDEFSTGEDEGVTEFIKKALNTVELDGNAGFTGKAQQQLFASYYQVDDIVEPDEVRFVFQADLPRDAVKDGMIIYQWALLTPTVADSMDPLGIACVVQVGNADGVVTQAFNGGAMNFASNSAVKWQSTNENFKADDIYLGKIDDPSFYATTISTFDRANKVQMCQAVLEIDKIDINEALFQTFTTTYGVRIYNDDDDVAPKNLGESTDDLKLERPTVKVAKWDEDIGIPDTLETYWYPVTSFQAEAGGMTHNLTVEYFATKEVEYQDALEFHFILRADPGTVAAGTKIVHYVQFKKEADTLYTGGMCITVAKSDPATPPEIITTIGSVANDGVATDANNPPNYNAPDSQTTEIKFRSVFEDYYYSESIGDDGKEEYRCAIALDVDKTNAASFKAIFATYGGFYGARNYDTDKSFETVHDGTLSVTFTKPTYEFGEEFEFNEAPQKLENFKSDVVVDLAVLDQKRAGVKGFAKMQGDFNIVPNFDQLFWQFTFSLEMPTDMFKPGNWVFFEASYLADGADPTDTVFLTCGVEVGNPLSAEVKEYDDTYTFGDPASSTPTDYDGWTKNFNLKNYNLVETINGKSRQNCAAMVPLDPEYVDSVLSGVTFNANFMTSVAQTKSDALVTVQAATTSTYSMGKPMNKDGTPKDFATFIEPLDDLVTDIQVIVEKESTISAKTVDEKLPEANVVQWVSAGFEINPLKQDAPDEFLIEFELDAPKELLTEGSRVFQYVTFQKKDALEEKPITVACATQTGDEYVSEILTYKGFTSMKEDSAKVKDLAYNKQNLAEKAKKKESFELVQDAEWYRTEDSYSAPGANKLQPCRAVLSMGKKLPSNDPFYGNYQFTVGARIYANDEAKTFKAIPAKVYDITVVAPETDLALKYEEQQPETSSEELIYFDERFKFKLQDVTGDANDAQLRGFQKVRGGYKLYGASDAEDRWFFNLGIELPADKFPEGYIFYQWLTYEDTSNPDSPLTGAVGCKVEIGDTSKTSTDQWLGVTNLSKENNAVKGEKWTKQVPEGKMREPSYRANWWDDSIFALKDSDRVVAGTNYKIQECEVEILLNKNALEGDKSFTLTTGVRVYASNTATSFTSSPEQTFEWFRQQMTYTPELEIPATYDEATRFVPAAANEKTLEPIDITTEFADRISALPSGGQEQVQKRERQQTANAVMSFANGYSLYKNIKESDWWWWWTALDINESLMKTGDIIYQFITITDTPKSTSFTIGCATTIGTDGYTLHYYKHDPANDATLLLSDNAANVVGKTWDAQAPTLKEEQIDIDWAAGSTHVPSDKRPPTTSATAGNKIYSCMFYEELKKIGRNPSDFDKTLDIQIGARIYEGAAATTFLNIPKVDDQITKPALPTYEEPPSAVDPAPSTPGGASELISALTASIVMLIALLY